MGASTIAAITNGHRRRALRGAASVHSSTGNESHTVNLADVPARQPSGHSTSSSDDATLAESGRSSRASARSA